MICIKKIRAYALFMIAIAASQSCATKPAAPLPDYRAMVSLRQESAAINLTSPDAAAFRAVLVLENNSPVEFFCKAIEQTLELDGVVIDLTADGMHPSLAGSLPASGALETELASEIRLSQIPRSVIGGYAQPESAWRLVSKALMEDDKGKAFQVTGEAAGTFMRVIVPALAVESITVRKMELINTKLKVDILVRNENGFPLILDAFDYALFGEGRFWARGKTAEEVVVDARSDKKIALELVMNFADMDRSVLDKVIYMKQVLCRLSGKIRLRTGLEFLPEFDLPFSIESEAPVAR